MDCSEYPSPIAVIYSDVLNERNIQEKFRTIINAFSVTLKYMALIIMNDYVRLYSSKCKECNDTRELEHREMFKRLNELFKMHIEKPSLGQWRDFLREIMAGYRGAQYAMFMPEMLDAYNKVAGIFDYLIFLRNNYVHPNITPDTGEAEKVSKEAMVKLDQLLSNVAFLKDYKLIRRIEGQTTEEECHGLGIQSAIETGKRVSYFIKSKEDRCGDPLHLGGFFYYCQDIRDASHRILLYETKKGKRIKYVLGNYYTIWERDNKTNADENHKDPVRYIEMLIQDLSSILMDDQDKQLRTLIRRVKAEMIGNFLSWESFRALSKIPNPLYCRFLSERKFDHSLYVERKKINEHLERFIEAVDESHSAKCMIIVAESGLGKTNLLYKWEYDLLNQGHIVFFCYGRNYNGEAIDEMLFSQLKKYVPGFEELVGNYTFFDILSLLSETRNRGQNLVILFDAINEYNYPEYLLEKLLSFIMDSVSYSWVKVIFTVRTFAWESLKDRSFDPEKFYYSDDEGSGLRPYILLNRFDNNELKTAYEKYREAYCFKPPFDDLHVKTVKLLSNPLLLRLAAETYEGDTIPDALFSDRIFEEYINDPERIRRRKPKDENTQAGDNDYLQDDEYFINYLIEAMWRLKQDALSFEDFDLDVSQKDTVLLEPSSVYPGTESLAEKLRDYIYTDPVYDKTCVPICANAFCRRYGEYADYVERQMREDGSEDIVGGQRCKSCGSGIEKKYIDFTTTYEKLQSENIIQEYSIDGSDGFIRFTYDRMFEYLLGRFLRDHVMRDFAANGPDRMLRVVEAVPTNFIFWGAIKNVIAGKLKDSGLSSEFWFDVFNYRENVLKSVKTTQDVQQILVAIKTILTAALIEYYNVDRDKSWKLLSYITDEARATKETMDIAMSVSHEVLIEAFQSSTENIQEIEILRRGLIHSNRWVRYESRRMALSLFLIGGNTAVLQLTHDLKDKLQSLLRLRRILRYLKPGNRKIIHNSFESLSRLLVLLLGSYYADPRLRDNIVSVVSDLLNNSIIKLFGAKLAANELAKAYWEKGPTPCCYIEMYIYLKSPYRGVATRIGELFASSLTLHTEEDLDKLCQIQNGLISWYMYSLLPLYVREKEDVDIILSKLTTIFDKGNAVARYIVTKVLWILAEIYDHDNQAVERAFFEYSRKMLEEYGGWLMFRHACDYDNVIQRYVEEEDKDGQRLRYWAEYKDGTLVVRYDNSALVTMAIYILKKEPANKLDIVLNLLESKKWKGNDEFLLYCIDALGEIGQQFPSPALKTLEHIIEKNIEYDKVVNHKGRTVKVVDCLVENLLRIKGFAPIQVNRFVESLNEKHAKRLQAVTMASSESNAELLSYYGDIVYQSTFKISDEMRRIFGKGTIAADKASTVEKLFRSYVSTVYDWHKSFKNRI